MKGAERAPASNGRSPNASPGGSGVGMGLLEGRVVLVSGVGPGLGRSVAKAVLREGGSVALGDLDGARAAEIRRELDPGETRSAVAALDITSGDSCDALVELARARFGRLDGVVHVAALDHVVGGLMGGGLDDWDRTAEINVKGTMRMTKAAVPLLSERGGLGRRDRDQRRLPAADRGPALRLRHVEGRAADGGALPGPRARPPSHPGQHDRAGVQVGARRRGLGRGTGGEPRDFRSGRRRRARARDGPRRARERRRHRRLGRLLPLRSLFEDHGPAARRRLRHLPRLKGNPTCPASSSPAVSSIPVSSRTTRRRCGPSTRTWSACRASRTSATARPIKKSSLPSRPASSRSSPSTHRWVRPSPATAASRSPATGSPRRARCVIPMASA
ncbi:MAG: SDR family oxidoreductase [Deltaproteobacteria bacterium]|nr:SDR family oxidoreductase [Deltaproteobacteria bacterium]